MLVEHQSPNAPLVERALTELRGTWPDRQITEAAEAAADAGERYVTRRAKCPGCGSSEALRRVRSSGEADAQTVQVADAVERLRVLDS